jgi:hypothetical protein
MVLTACRRPGRTHQGVVVHDIAVGERLISVHDVQQLYLTLADLIPGARATRPDMAGTGTVLSPVAYKTTSCPATARPRASSPTTPSVPP